MRAERVGSETVLSQIVQLRRAGAALARADAAPGRHARASGSCSPVLGGRALHVRSLWGFFGPEPSLDATRWSTRSPC